MPPALSYFKKMHEVSHSIPALFSETTPELGSAPFGFPPSDLAPKLPLSGGGETPANR